MADEIPSESEKTPYQTEILNQDLDDKVPTDRQLTVGNETDENEPDSPPPPIPTDKNETKNSQIKSSTDDLKQRYQKMKEQKFISGINCQIMGSGKSYIILNTIYEHYLNLM